MKEISYKWDASKYKSSSKLQADIGSELLKHVQVSEGDCILDAGCGVGNFSLELACKAPNVQVIGIDLSASMINQCNDLKSNKEIKNIEFINMSLTDIQYVNKFDIIFSNSVLHWVKDIKKVLNAFAKSLKPGGHVALQFPLINSSHPLMNFTSEAIKQLGLNDYYKKWDSPWYVPSPEEFKSLLVDEKFKNISVCKKESCFKFNSVKEAYSFLDAVGLKLFLEPLLEEKKELLIEKVYDNLQQISVNDEIELKFERIFAFANY